MFNEAPKGSGNKIEVILHPNKFLSSEKIFEKLLKLKIRNTFTMEQLSEDLDFLVNRGDLLKYELINKGIVHEKDPYRGPDEDILYSLRHQF